MILICYGTRPEWLKIKPILPYLKNYNLFFTGQSKDLVGDIYFPKKIEEHGHHNRLTAIVANALLEIPNHEDIDSVLVQGDTASAFACALAAFHMKKKIYHVEAGLRSGSLKHPYPEEGYRQMISRIADIHFCPTKGSSENLAEENILGQRYIVGNTVLDNIKDRRSKTKYTNKVLVTMHRRENHEKMADWFYEIDQVAKLLIDYEFIFPMHPNPNVQKHKPILRHVNVIDPLSHADLIDLLAECKFVITDSGGLQEEGAFLNKKIIVCRRVTERPEGLISGHLIMCVAPWLLKNKVMDLMGNYEINAECPYGDGESGKRIAEMINND